MATIAELDGYRFETVHGVMGWYLDNAENEVEPFVRLVRKSDGAHIDYGLDYEEGAIARLLCDHVHGSIDQTWLRGWIAQEERAGELDWGAEPYWLPAQVSALVEGEGLTRHGNVEHKMTEFIVEGMDEAAAASDGTFVRVSLRDAEGKALVLVIPSEAAGTLAHELSAIVEAAAGVDSKMGNTSAAMVRDLEVFGASDGSVIGVTLQSGEARLNYALTPNLSERLRRGLQAAEKDAEAKRQQRN